MTRQATTSVRWLGAQRVHVITLLSLAALLIAGVMSLVIGDHAYRASTVRGVASQASLLSSAVGGALAFDDDKAAQTHVDALRFSTRIVAAGVYDRSGSRVAGFSRDQGSLAELDDLGADATRTGQGHAYVGRAVSEAGVVLGSVRLKAIIELPAQRASRYAGPILLFIMAALLVVVLNLSRGSLRRANAELAVRNAELGQANDRLQTEMHERQRAEEALRQSQKMDALGQLVGGIAHDFNNLLMVISGGLQLLDRTDDPAKRDRLRLGVQQGVDRGVGLTRQLLAFSRTSALQARVVEIPKLLENVSMLLERSLRENIVVDISAPAETWRVEVDPSELELALVNLAVNARDAMPDGGVLRVTAHNRPPDEGLAVDHVRLVVADTGFGMSEETAKRVFEPFFTTKGVGRGTGLGLSQVYGFARSSGGRASVESQEGQGARVILDLPRTDKVAELAEIDGVSTPPTRNQGRVLLVEDDPAVAEMTAGLLVELGYAVDRAADGRAALDRLDAAGPYDLMLSDMVMPGDLTGLALASATRELRPQLPIVLVTGYSEAATDARSAGFQVLSKPYTLLDLRAALELSSTQAASSPQ